MVKYIVCQGFHLGEIGMDIAKGVELEFDEALGHLRFGESKHNVRSSPIIGAIKKGWLRLKDEVPVSEESPVKFEGVEEFHNIFPEKSEKDEIPSKKEIGRMEYEEDVRNIKDVSSKVEKKIPIKIGFENREDEKVSISLDNLKNLTNVNDEQIVKNWDLTKHWATRKKEMMQINNINTLMKIASIDPTLKKYIDVQIKGLSPLGHEVDKNLESVKTELPKSELPKEESKNSKLASLGQDFDTYVKEELQKEVIQTPKPKIVH